MAISSLYTGSRVGDYWIPSTSHAFTDAGTTPVASDGDLIYQINGQRGSINLVQTTSGNRPTWRSNVAGLGRAYELDGAGDCFADISINYGSSGATAGTTIGILWIPDTTSAYQNIFEAGVSNRDPMIWIDSSNREEMNGGGTGGINLPTVTASDAISEAVHTSIFRNKKGQVECFRDGVSKGLSTSATNDHLSTALTANIHNRGGASTLKGQVACFVLIAGDGGWCDDTEVATLHSELMALLPSTGNRRRRVILGAA